MSEIYNIKSFAETKFTKVDGIMVYDLFTPTMIMNPSPELRTYEVVGGEEGRIDLVVNSIYGLESAYAAIDVILYINNIDNPLNIMKGMVLLYPSPENLDSFRYDRQFDRIDIDARNRTLGTATAEPNKSTVIDPNRSKYLDKISYPPTVNQVPTPGVRAEGDKFLIGGIN
jgi:hypothetical protein